MPRVFLHFAECLLCSTRQRGIFVECWVIAECLSRHSANDLFAECPKEKHSAKVLALSSDALSGSDSRLSTDTTSATNSLTSGYTMVATIRYENTTQLLHVHLKINDKSYNVSATVDLTKYLPENVAVSFSAGTGGAGELHQILAWSFVSTLEAKIQTIARLRWLRKRLPW